MKKFLLIIFLLQLSIAIQAQTGDGFYLPIDKKDCGRKIMEFADETFCLPEQPIFGLEVIDSVTEISRIKSMVFFDLRIKRAEASKLKKVIEGLNQYNLVIVLDNELVGLAKFEPLSDYTKLRFYSSKLQGKIDQIHAYLREVLKTLNGKGEG